VNQERFNAKETKMKIDELKLQFPTVRFYRLATKPEFGVLQLDKIEDLMDLTSQIAYFESEIDAEFATRMNIESVLETYIDKVPYMEKREFERYFCMNVTDKFEKLCAIDGHTTLDLYAIGQNISYCETKGALSKESFEKALKELDRMYDVFCETKQKEEEKKNKDVDALIDSYKEKYCNARTKKEKEDLITEIQMRLKEKFQMDGRADYKASKAYLRVRFDS
jgi:hypothetical protein